MNLAMRRIAAASFVGALLEWYDFYAFATASALVFGPLFFPSGDPLLSIMASFGAFASGFLARPIGGLIFGDIGDRIGRKASLIATLVIIGTGTFLIGLLPTFAQAGIWAPILLVILRVLQGIGLGGEYAGASLITIEHAPSGRRGFWGSLPQAASPGGLLLSSLVFELIALLPPGAFIAWGWRVPFLLSAIMLGIGLYVRLHIAETPEFEAIRDLRTELPIVDLLRTHGKAALLATGARLAETVSGNMIKSFGLTYVIGAKPRAAGPASGGLAAAADEVWKLRDGRTAADAEPGAKIVPEGDAELPAGLGEPEEGVAAVAADVAVGSAADVALGHLAADVVFRAVGVQRDFRVIEHHQQLGLVGVQPLQQAVEGDEAGAPLKDAIEARPQFTASAWRRRRAGRPSGRHRTTRSARGHAAGRHAAGR